MKLITGSDNNHHQGTSATYDFKWESDYFIINLLFQSEHTHTHIHTYIHTYNNIIHVKKIQ